MERPLGKVVLIFFNHGGRRASPRSSSTRRLHHAALPCYHVIPRPQLTANGLTSEHPQLTASEGVVIQKKKCGFALAPAEALRGRGRLTVLH